MLWCQRGKGGRNYEWETQVPAQGENKAQGGRRCLHKVSAGAEVPSQLAHSRCFPSWLHVIIATNFMAFSYQEAEAVVN